MCFIMKQFIVWIWIYSTSARCRTRLYDIQYVLMLQLYTILAQQYQLQCVYGFVCGSAFFYYFLLSFFNFIIFHSTLDDKHQAKFVSCFKLFSFLLLSFGKFIVNVHVRVCMGERAYFSINFRFNCILFCMCGRGWFFVCFCGDKWLLNRKFPQVMIYYDNSNFWELCHPHEYSSFAEILP